MPSLDHEIYIRLFRNRPKLAVELLRDLTNVVTPCAHVVTGESTMTQAVPVEFRADLVLRLLDRERRVIAAIVIEVQRSIDNDKLLSWPVYITHLRSEENCPVMLLVIAPDLRVAAWASKSIELGHPGFQLTPIVLGPDRIPHILDPKTASNLPELSMLSALAHRDAGIARITISAIETLPRSKRDVYLSAINDAFGVGLTDSLGGCDDEHY